MVTVIVVVVAAVVVVVAAMVVIIVVLLAIVTVRQVAFAAPSRSFREGILLYAVGRSYKLCHKEL